MNLRKGDVFRHELPGGGGWGDPLDRDPVSVLSDVRNEYISVKGANSDYGVVVDSATWTVDLEATRNVRKSRRKSRGDISTSVINWEEE